MDPKHAVTVPVLEPTSTASGESAMTVDYPGEWLAWTLVSLNLTLHSDWAG
jgi:hypothetical protein